MPVKTPVKAAPKTAARAPSSGRGSKATVVVPPSAKAKAKVALAPPSAPPLPETAVATAGASYEGRPLALPQAEALLKDMPPEHLVALAESTDEEEQLPARMMLEFVGDKDHSWENARRSLLDAPRFRQEILEMEGANFVTKRSLERMEGLGAIKPGQLMAKQSAAFALAVYVEAVIDAAREKLGLKEIMAVAPPEPDEEPPNWPITIDMAGIPKALSDAVKWRRTPLFVCNGKAQQVDTFFTYQACSLVDAKWVLSMNQVKKELDVPQMREELRKRLAAAIKFGKPIHICMSNSAVALREKYCAEAEFPEALFKLDAWLEQAVYSKVLREADLADWPGAFPGRMRDGNASYAFVTTDFDLASAREYLPEALPYFDSMAVIEIDPASIH
mmetsp:Transcript_1409/g.3153  ORF Transcript_1409/g.3153 Transcript_1409/m.3153 type:complete len:389 (+) Transcript_1409:76-1242(+)